jgi:hypothetical protein
VEGDVTVLEAGTGNAPNPGRAMIMFYYLDFYVGRMVLMNFGLIGTQHFQNILYMTSS